MKKIAIVLCLLMVCGCLGSNSEELLSSYNRASYKDDASKFVGKSSIYRESGYRVVCENAKNDINGDWLVSCFFYSKESGFDKIHNVSIRYTSKGMSEAIEDGKYNMMG